MKKFLVIIALFILVFILNVKEEEYYVIPSDAIRFRIIANSNSVNDQFIKIKVRDEIEKSFSDSLNSSSSIEDSRSIIKSNIGRYEDIVLSTLNKYNYSSNFNINYGENYFPEKVYKGVKYEAGNYESLVISLGEAKGDNWWCVLFPPICNLEFSESDSKKVEYKFMVKDIVDKYMGEF